jgi:hypothetical protein
MATANMMVAMGHGLCVCFGVCGKTTKNKEERKMVEFPRAGKGELEVELV